jgi:hypothetical protein
MKNQNSDTTIKPAKEWVIIRAINRMDYYFKDKVFYTLFPTHS